MSHRIGFDPNLPLVASTDFLAGDVELKVGDAVDWKKLGITEQVAFDWWRSGMISHPEDAKPFTPKAIVEADEPAEDVMVAAVIADVMDAPHDAEPKAHAKPKHTKKH